MVGKWHCGSATWKHTPYYRGFKTYLGYFQGQGDYFKHCTSAGAELDVPYGLDFWDNDKPLFSAVGTYSLDLYDARISKILNDYTAQHDTKQKQVEHPLFVYLAHQTVHLPLQPRRDEVERCGKLKHAVRRVYCSMLVELDDSIGSTVEQYKAHGLWDNTLVLLLTDNSGMVNWDPYSKDNTPRFPSSQGSNFPLRGSKSTLFDGGVRSLGFISGGAFPKQHAGQRYKGLAHVVDLSATVLAAAGIYPVQRESLRLDGHDLMPLLTKTGGLERSDVPINIIAKGEAYSAIRFGKYKLIVRDLLVPHASHWYDVNGDLLEQAPPAHDQILLFDIDSDEQERHDLSAKHPELVRHGLQLIRSYVIGGNYMEPQGPEVNLTKGLAIDMDVRCLPIFHGGTWAPYMSEREWRRLFDKELVKNGLKSINAAAVE